MAKLEEEHKRFIVQELARFRTPSEVADLVKETFEIAVERQQVWHYRVDNPELADAYKELYRETREQFIRNVASIGSSHKSVRVRELEDLYRQAKKMKNYGLAKELLEQIAKEVGDVYTNKRNVNINPREALAELLGVEPGDLPTEQSPGEQSS